MIRVVRRLWDQSRPSTGSNRDHILQADFSVPIRQIEVQLREDLGEICLVVSDLGKGFDLETAVRGRGLGLASMQERVRLVNGTIEIQSKHGYPLSRWFMGGFWLWVPLLRPDPSLFVCEVPQTTPLQRKLILSGYMSSFGCRSGFHN
jgi:hypothetical protein